MNERKLIYADDVIRWIKTESNPYGKPTLDFESGKKVIAYLERMPTAQPDSLVRPSARWMNVGHKRARICSSCFRDEPYKFADNDADVYDFCPHCGARMEVRTEMSSANDTISRQAAIDALCDNCDDVKAVCAHYPCKQCIAIEQLPSAPNDFDELKCACSDCQEFDCYGCEHKEELK